MEQTTKPRKAAKMLTNSTANLALKINEPRARRHYNEMAFGVDGFGANIAAQVKAWAAYADLHFARYESVIGEDGYMGIYWEDQGKNLIALLNGETGGLDCGTLDGVIRKIGREHGLRGETWDAA